MDVELDPPQPDELAAAIAALLAEAPREPDPWWEAGIRADLGT